MYPLMMVPKKFDLYEKSKMKIFLDLRRLNDATNKDFYPISFTNMTLDIVAGQEFYSFMDENLK